MTTLIAADRQPPARAAHSFLSVVVGLGLIAAAIALLLNQEGFRRTEAMITASVLSLFTDGDANGAGTIVYIGIGTGSVNGLAITFLCSTVVLVTPLLLIAGSLCLLPRFGLGRVLGGLAIALPIAVASNLARYSLIALALQLFGSEGFDLVHHYLGSFLVILGLAFAIFVLLRVATGLGRRRVRRHASR
ncbi:exosortase S [Compostimonas suwonensis]|uniref:Exosortase/archaeosortase family protein n=1 Tax=Compostimonas suwonensis TaxID=1048394 RepID=A0A2M9BUE4_9MICO|nr:exosortase S [Compostimonas suwonensis]PJJ61532.1 exosortase/archaeosortase family protein [Compostimonas suwonensis]